MPHHENADTGCRMVGEYVDEAEMPEDATGRRGEVVRPRMVAGYVDEIAVGETLREFNVLLNDGRVVSVRGHHLKSDLPRAAVFSIVVRTQAEDVVVALFRSDDVSGIFDGELRPDRRIA